MMRTSASASSAYKASTTGTEPRWRHPHQFSGGRQAIRGAPERGQRPHSQTGFADDDDDFIVLDRNFFDVPAEQIANIKVLQTVVGGRVVYEAGEVANRHQ